MGGNHSKHQQSVAAPGVPDAEYHYQRPPQHNRRRSQTSGESTRFHNRSNDVVVAPVATTADSSFYPGPSSNSHYRDIQGPTEIANSADASVAREKSVIEKDQLEKGTETDEYVRMYEIQKELPPCARTRTYNGLVPTVFRWDGGGKEVNIAGSFTNWKQIAMHRSGNDFQYIQDLPKGKHPYKFIVDGQWCLHDNLPKEPDEHGNVNNVVDLSTFQPHSASDLSLATTDTEPDVPYSNEVPGDDIYTKDPPPLPSQLRHIILNSEVRDSKGDHKELPSPSHVTVNHLYCAAIKDGVMVQGTTRRYRRKAVTVVYYSIMPSSSLTQPSPISAYITRMQGPSSQPSASQVTSNSGTVTRNPGDSQESRPNRLVQAMTKEEKELLQQRHAQIEAQLQQEQSKLQQQLQAGMITHEEATKYLSNKHAQAQQTLTQIQQSILAHVENRLLSQQTSEQNSNISSRPPPHPGGHQPSVDTTSRSDAQEYAANAAAKFAEAHRKYQ